jgi:hypothetical protein
MLKAWAEVWFILAEGRRTLGFLRIYRPRRRRIFPLWCGLSASANPRPIDTLRHAVTARCRSGH